MNCIIPFTKDIKFKTNISEILSISLEHEYTINDSELLGNFIITGDYKSHEVSVNKEKFEHVLPFSVTLTTNINPETLDFNVEDFTYEVIDNNVLKVDIEYSVKADEVEDLAEDKLVFERIESEEESVEDLLEQFDEEVEKDEERLEEEALEVEEEIKEEKLEEQKVEVEEDIRDEVTEEQKETILNSINAEDNTFVTYRIHVLKENETIETICTMYNTSGSLLEEYNDMKNINVGDKIIIPDDYE